MSRRTLKWMLGTWLSTVGAAFALGAAPAERPAAKNDASAAQGAKVGKLPFIEFDARAKQVRVECEVVNVDTPLEFFCVGRNGPDHETVLRSQVKPSDLHAAMLAVGLKPGAPLSWSEEQKKWLPPSGASIDISVRWKDGDKTINKPANEMMRDLKTKKPMPATHWVFAGSRVLEQGQYAADITGYIVSIVNFDLTVVDIPNLASSANETLEWERNPDATPPAETKVTMIIEPHKADADAKKEKPPAKVNAK